MDNRLLSEFLAEADYLIEELYDDVAALRARRSEGRERRALVARIFRRVHTIKGSAAAADESDDERLLPAETARALSAHERQRLREAVSEGARAYIVEADFRLATFDEQYRRLSDALSEGGEVVSTQPFVEPGAPEHVGFRIV